MPNYSNAVNTTSTDAMWAILQEQNEQSQQNQREENKRQVKREDHDYKSARASDQARTEESSKNEAINKSKAQGRVRQNSALKQDSILPSAPSDDMTKNTRSLLQKPPMEKPSRTFGSGAPATNSSSDDQDADNISVIALLARVLCLQAKSNTAVWQVLFKQSGEYQQMSLQMAQAQANSTQSQWEEQSQATKAQADMSKEDGKIDLSFFAFSCVAGALDPAAGEGAGEEESADETLGRDQTQAAERAAAGQSEQAAEQGASQAAQNAENSAASGLKKVGRGFLKASKGFLKIMGKLGGGIKYAQFFQMASQGIKGLWIDGPKLAEKAAHEGAAGVAAATAQVAQGYSEYNNQSFSRTEEIRQGAGQNVEYAMNVYKSASDSITQAVSAMYSR